MGSRAHEFSKRFGTKCLSEPLLCTGAELAEPAGIAADEESGNLYVGDRTAARVVEFDKDGTFLKELTGPNAEGSGNLTEGSATIESAIAAKGAFTVGEELTAEGLPAETKITAVEGATLTVSNPVEAGKSGVGVQLKAQQRFERPESLAVDNFCPLSEPKLSKAECEAQDPSSGDLYVADTGEFRGAIDKFSPSGEFRGQITHAGATPFINRALDGVAVDPHGAVWVYREEPAQVDGFSNAAQNEFIPPEIALGRLGPSHAEGFARPASLAVDSKGNFYGLLEAKATIRVPKWDHSGAVLNEALDGEGSTAVATEQIGDAVLIDNGTGIDVFGPDENLIERLGEEGGEKHLGQSGQSVGVGTDLTAGFVYASDTGAGEVVVFGPAKPTVPKIEGQSVSSIGSDHATLAASINPRSEEGEDPTTYRFQYGRCATPTTCSSSGYEAETPVGQLPADFEVHAVSAKLEDLKSGTTYHFRAVATNAHGQGTGESVIFSTEGEGGSLSLPDHRGWELVSPPDKQGAKIAPISEFGVVQAAASGGGITYLANLPTEASPEGFSNEVQILSRRGSASWSSRDIAIPHAGATGFAIGPGPEYKFFNPELTSSAVQPFGPFNPALSEEASESTAFLHDLSEGCGSHCFRPLVTAKSGFANVPEGTVFGGDELCEPRPEQSVNVVCGPQLLGAVSDLSHVILTAGAALVPGAPSSGGLFEWSSGTLSQVSVLPGGEPSSGGELGRSSQSTPGAIAAEGTRIAWSENKNLYERDTAREETVQLDSAEAGCGFCESGGGHFQAQSTDGTRVLFTDEKPLSKDSGAAPEKPDLYECRIAVVGGKLSCALSDMTPAHEGKVAEVQGALLGGSEDASTLYFVAKGVLSEVAGTRGTKAQQGKSNLYASKDGTMRFIATLIEGDEHDWNAPVQGRPTRVSPNGRYLELMSEAPLTGYDNHDRETGEPTAEVYIYDAESNQLRCASCNPSGERPVGVEYHKLEPGSGGLVGGGRETWTEGLVAANVPGWTTIHSAGPLESRYQPNYLNNQGRLFFDSVNALIPQDSNANQDVYEYEPPGIGSCTEADPTYSAKSGGCVSLISSGRSSQESAFMDSSISGDDVFFLTSAKLSPLDTDSARDIYDAHVCTTPSEPCITFPTSEVPPCTGESSCKASPTPQPAIFGAPASVTFQGPGNPTPKPPGPPKAKTPEEIRLERLHKALKACRAKHNKHKRQACEKQARKRYAKPKAKSKARKSKARKRGHK